MKYIVFLISLSFSILFLITWQFDFADELIRFDTKINNVGVTNIIFVLISFFPVISLFSSLTVLLPEKFFVAWWRFARVSIPIVFSISFVLLLELHHSQVGSGWIGPGEAYIDRLFLFLLYIVFSLISLWIIIRTYWKSRVGQSHTTG